MTVKAILTRATGYLGGDVLYQLHQRYPDFHYVLLIRTQDKAKNVLARCLKARIVIGSNDDSALLEREAAWANTVIHTADSSDHDGAAKAIAKGLLHTGGAGILTYFDSEVKKTFGEHADAVKTAIICLPRIHGEGRGLISGRGRQVYELASFGLKEQYYHRIGKGLSRWKNVHIHVAINPSLKGDPQIWGVHGYYFTENGEHVRGDLSVAVGEKAFNQEYIKGGGSRASGWSIKEVVKSSAGFEAASWSMTSHGVAARAKKVLSWKQEERSLSDELPDIIRSEAARMGL
ncbi:hypothetical protein BDV39DRAFT_193162 [Aspergillus sergii]|uniref:NAD(P)-binding domain-containing protein n=1 Tax=Aspergillus sergii TaxID=1034303 RepID=A0A5N6X620_9EURO|nr:hypothetical protein BDV39DRAFT_193162 [Aspergillus sergii]